MKIDIFFINQTKKEEVASEQLREILMHLFNI